MAAELAEQDVGKLLLLLPVPRLHHPIHRHEDLPRLRRAQAGRHSLILPDPLEPDSGLYRDGAPAALVSGALGYFTGSGRVMQELFGPPLAGRASRGLGYRSHVPRSGVQSAYRDVLGFSRFISARA